jgi:two-component system response regulator AdeR
MARPPLILVVDDDPDIVASLVNLLTAQNYRVATAAHGGEALLQIERERPVAVLLDLTMPVMNGWQLIDELQRRGLTDLHVILMSADPAVAEHAARLCGGRWMSKPFRFDRLNEQLEQAVGRHRLAS